MVATNVGKIYGLLNAEAVLTEASDLRQYLTGVKTSFGYVITDSRGSIFYTDMRYLEGAEKSLEGTDIEVRKFGGSLEEILKPYKEVAIPLERTLIGDYNVLKDMGLKIVDSTKAFQSAMSVKSAEEIELIDKACKITDEAFTDLLRVIREGMSENDVAAELEYLMRKHGASGTSFETIVCFGANASVPHHETGADKLKFGDGILIDFGCKYGGYCSDCTRTFLFGDDGKHGEFKKAYSVTLGAQKLVKEKVHSGMLGREADALARNYLTENGFGEYFIHSLGHGIGLNIHEFPKLSAKSEDILSDGMVFSDEPGVYVAGKYGIRIEDTVVLENGKIKTLTNTDKNLLIL